MPVGVKEASEAVGAVGGALRGPAQRDIGAPDTHPGRGITVRSHGMGLLSVTNSYVMYVTKETANSW